MPTERQSELRFALRAYPMHKIKSSSSISTVRIVRIFIKIDRLRFDYFMYIREIIWDFANCRSMLQAEAQSFRARSRWNHMHQVDFNFRNNYPWSRLMSEKELVSRSQLVIRPFTLVTIVSTLIGRRALVLYMRERITSH